MFSIKTSIITVGFALLGLSATAPSRDTRDWTDADLPDLCQPACEDGQSCFHPCLVTGSCGAIPPAGSGSCINA